ncbi:MAG: tetratricopeptide repeat protein, partial [bacterium]|nr:tetratricopeptide repeat protein [bacterium]
MKIKNLLLIILVAGTVHFNLLKTPFLYDDRDIIVSNVKLHNINNITKIFSKQYYIISGEVSYRPILTTLHFLNYYIWNGKAAGFRIVEIFIYLLVVIFVYIVTLKLFKSEKFALISSLIFCVHPVHTEALGCVALGFGELLSCLFLLLAFLYHIKTTERFNIDNIVFTFLFWILALLSKETTIVFPVIATVHLFSLQTKTKKFYYLLGGYLLIVIFYLIVKFRIMYLPESRYIGYVGGSFYVNFLTMSNVFRQYLFLLVFPIKLAVEYPPDIITTVLNPRAILGITTIICIIILVMSLIKQKKWQLLIMTTWLIVPIIPVMNIIPFLKASLLNVRYLFIPSIGFCWLLCFLLMKVGFYKTFTKILLVFVLLIFSVRTIIRNYDWTDEVRLWQKNVKMYPNFSRPYLSLGGAYYYRSEIEKAVNEYQKMILLEPDDPEPYYNIGVIRADAGDIQTALEFYKKSYEIVKNYLQDAPFSLPIVKNVYEAIGKIYEKQNDEKSALFYYKKAGTDSLYFARKYYNSAIKHVREKEYGKAIEELFQSLKLNPQYAKAYNELANIYNIKKMYADAIIYSQKAILVDIELGLAYFNAAWSSQRLGKVTDAIKYYEKGLQLSPKNIQVLYELAKLYNREKDYKNAITYYYKILSLEPKNLNIYNHLAICY